MHFERRDVIFGGGAALLLAGCMDSPGALTVSAQGAAGMNPGPDGADRPLTLTVVQLRSAGAFDSADFFALQNPAAALGGDLVKTDQIVLTPGASASKVIGIQEGASVVGIIAGFRDPAGKVFRLKTPAPGGQAGVIVSVGAGGISMISA